MSERQKHSDITDLSVSPYGMHLCMITEYFPTSDQAELRGGVEARTYHLARELAKRHTVTVITSYESGGPRTHKIGNVTVIRCGKHVYTHSGALHHRLRFAFSIRRVRQQLRNNPPDIIEGENFLCYLPAFNLARSLGAKAVATYHETWLGSWIRNKGLLTGIFGSTWERMALRKPWDAIIAVSEFTKRRLIVQGIPASHITVVPNGIDPLEYPTGDLAPDKFLVPTICCIARLTRAKGIHTILDAVAKLKAKHPKLQLKVIGTGAEEDTLKRQATRLGIADRVEFLGYLPAHATTIGTLIRSHLFCSASTVEGFGIAVLEAMACGIPYVVSRIPPHQEITSNGIGGMLFKPDDADDLAEKLEYLLTHPEYAVRKATEGQRHALKYQWTKIAEQLEEVYAKL